MCQVKYHLEWNLRLNLLKILPEFAINYLRIYVKAEYNKVIMNIL